MEMRVYKKLLNGKETIDSYTILLKPTKRAALQGVGIEALCCNVCLGKVYGYWMSIDPAVRIGVDFDLGKRQKPENLPPLILQEAELLTQKWSSACKKGDWSEWESTNLNLEKVLVWKKTKK